MEHFIINTHSRKRVELFSKTILLPADVIEEENKSKGFQFLLLLLRIFKMTPKEKIEHRAAIFYLAVGILSLVVGLLTMNMPIEVQSNFNLTEGAWVGIGWFIVIMGSIFVCINIYLTKRRLK